jgi:hypothetical protein
MTRFAGFALEGLKLFGIAALALLTIWAAVIVSIKTGISIPARWLGLFAWTCALLWVVFRQCKSDLRSGRFWLALAALLAVHVAAFTLLLRAYPEWRMAWFVFVFLIEAPLLTVTVQGFVHTPGRKHLN